ncbi:FecCD family ABC transporter permease [Planosporangium sp. 12N6]|uniref:FecCD family ABC transporter permease n=1 Tax=Planosporangium spinosum TaxID=3402278 RepID=UPI003CEF04AC
MVSSGASRAPSTSEPSVCPTMSRAVAGRRVARTGVITGRRVARTGGLLTALLLLLAVVAASLAVGARQLPLVDAWRGLVDESAAAYPVVHGIRLPRTLLGLLAGVALGLAGGLMQALTRNPLADPGLLGVNAGAAAAVVSAISFLGITSLGGYVWFAFAGAGLVAALVWAVGGGRAATPVRLALAGTAVNAALYAYVNAVQLLDTAALDRLRFWTVGSLAAARPATVTGIAPFVAAGTLLAGVLARPLNVLVLGDDAARALGGRPAATRAAAMVAVTLLCGAATAACGPIVFVGLMVPHLVRPLTGPDLRWLLPYCAVLAPLALLGADVLGRVLARPGEVAVGVVTAVLGGGFFLAVVRRTRMAAA